MALLIVVFLVSSAAFIFFSKSIGIRGSIIQSYLLVFGTTVLLTETLSIFNFLSYQSLVFAWVLLDSLAILSVVYVIITKSQKNRYVDLREKLSALQNLSWISKLILVCIGLTLLITFIIAVSAPPNTFDSMTYHMSRVANWIQQKSAGYYPTGNERQNYSMPLAEYMILHIQILSKSDLYANLVQWSGFLVALLVVADICRVFNISQTGQLVSALFVSTMPAVILQSTSTQNDLLAGVFCLIFVYYLILVISDFSWKKVILAGLGMGFALMTKGTSYVYCASIGIFLGGVSLITKNKTDKMRLFKGFVVLVVLALVINGGIYIRNVRLYSHPLSTENDRVTNDRISPSVLYANLVRNGAMHIAVPIPDINEALTSLVLDHLGEKATDPDSTYRNSKFRIKFLINEDEAGNLLHFILYPLLLIIVFWRGISKDKILLQYLGGIIICVLLYSLFFKWQPWGNRLQLPIFLLSAPLVGYGFDKIRPSSTLLFVLILGFSLYSYPYLVLNTTRPLVPIFRKNSPFRANYVRKFFSNRPTLYNEYAEIIAPFYKDVSVLRTDREYQYFAGNSSRFEDYQNIMAVVNQMDIDEIGLHLTRNAWEYPLWVQANKHASYDLPIFKHIGMGGKSQEIPADGDGLPRYVITNKYVENGYLVNNNYSIVVDTPSIDLVER